MDKISRLYFTNAVIMNSSQKQNWVRKNYVPFGWSTKEYEKQLREIDLNHKYLGVFSNGNHPGSGSLLFSLDKFQGNSLLFKRLHILADDIFGGGPTQQVIYDFLESGLQSLVKKLPSHYQSLYFKLKEITIFEESSFPSSIKEYHPKLKEKISRDNFLNLYSISIKEVRAENNYAN